MQNARIDCGVTIELRVHLLFMTTEETTRFVKDQDKKSFSLQNAVFFCKENSIDYARDLM